MTALITRDRLDGSKADTANGVNVANFLLGTGNAWDCLQTLGVGITGISAGTATLTQASAGLCLIDASAGNVIINLPACSAAVGALFQFKRIDTTANTVTINRAGADTIDGQTSVTLAEALDFIEMRCDGVSVWRPLNNTVVATRELLTAGTATAYTISPMPALNAYKAGRSFYVNFNAASGLNPTLQISGLATPPQLVQQQADGTYANVVGIPLNHRSRVTLLSATQIWVETMPPPAPPGLKNRIINGAMNIDQRNSGAAITVTTQVAALDRFGVANTTATGTLTVQQSTVAGFGKSLKATATAAITALTTTLNARPCYQVIEAQNCFDLNAKTVTLSFTVETNWTGNLPVSVRNSGNTRSYVTNVAVVSGINTRSVVVPLEAATIATNDIATGLNIDIGFCNEATFQTATMGSWLAGDFRTATTSTQWCKTLGNFVNVTQLQLEQGAVATTFEQRPIGLELALCQRHFRWIDGNLRFAAAAASQILVIGIQFQDMRATPTVGAMIAKPGGATVIQNTTGITTDRVTPSSANINCASTAGGDIFALNYYAPATSEYF